MSKQKNEQKRRRERARRKRLNLQQVLSATGVAGNDFARSANVVAMEIHEEVSEMNPPLTPKGDAKVTKAHELAGEGRYREAIDLLTEVNAEEPGRTSIIYNIATFRLLLGEEGAEEAYDEAIDMLRRDFPDYLFAQTAYAQRLIKQGLFEEAWEILQSLYKRKRLHIAEFKALKSAVITYHLAKGNDETAERIHQSVLKVCDDDSFPSMESFHRTFLANTISRIIAMGGNRRRRKKSSKKVPEK